MPHQQRPTGPHGQKRHDGKAPDGFTVNGWRRVCKGGYVRFCGGNHYHEQLNAWAGLWVFVEAVDCWCVHVRIWPEEPWKARGPTLNCANEMEWQKNAAAGAAFSKGGTAGRRRT